MRLVRFLALAVLCAVVPAFGQTATLTVDQPTLRAEGGAITFTASVAYEGEPGALGWAITLPEEWSFVSVGGANPPDIAPQPGSSGTLEFAYTRVPPQGATFTVVVRYPADAKTAQATSLVLVRAGGKLTTVKPAPVGLSRPGSN